MNTTNTHIADAMESNGEVFLLDTSPSSGEPAALEVLAAHARGEIAHRNQGQCPDAATGPASRDPDCIVCRALSSAPSPAQVQPSAMQAEPGALDERKAFEYLDDTTVETLLHRHGITVWGPRAEDFKAGYNAALSQRAPTTAAEAAPVVPSEADLVPRGMSWPDTLAMMKEACAQAGVEWEEDKNPVSSIAINIMQRLANTAHKAGFKLALERAAHAPQAVEAQQAGSGGHCVYCNDTGDVHGPDGEWRGVCDCAVGKALASRAAPAEPAVAPEGYLPIPEDEQERRLFDLATETYGRDVRANINLTLRQFAKQRPGGSYEAIMNIMANEVIKLHVVPTTEPAPSVTDAQLRALASTFTRSVETPTRYVMDSVSFGRAVLALAQGGAK